MATSPEPAGTSRSRFQDRHIGPSPHDRQAMLEAVGVASLDALMDEAIPSAIRLSAPLDLPEGESEHALLAHLSARNLGAGAPGSRLAPFRSFLGQGYYGCVTPAVIVRNLLENPGWYTPYTPY